MIRRTRNQPRREYRHKPRALNNSDLYARDDFEQQFNFEDEEDYYDNAQDDTITAVVEEQKECNSPPQQPLPMAVLYDVDDDDDDDWCVIGDDEKEEGGDSDVTSEWSFTDNLGTFLSAATHGLRGKEEQVKPSSSFLSSNAIAVVEQIAVKEEDSCAVPTHFDYVDEHWAHKQKGKQKVTSRVLHGRKS